MRAVITAVTVFAATLAICITCYCIATDFSTEMDENIKKIQKHIEEREFEKAVTIAEKSIEKFETSEILLAAISNHQELVSIKNGLINLRHHLKYNSASEAYVISSELTELLNRFYNSERLTVENIF